MAKTKQETVTDAVVPFRETSTVSEEVPSVLGGLSWVGTAVLTAGWIVLTTLWLFVFWVLTLPMRFVAMCCRASARSNGWGSTSVEENSHITLRIKGKDKFIYPLDYGEVAQWLKTQPRLRRLYFDGVTIPWWLEPRFRAVVTQNARAFVRGWIPTMPTKENQV